MDPIAKTSLMTAGMRALETKRSDPEGRLFSDPYAELLAGEEGMALVHRAINEVGDQPAVAIRTAFMDQKTSEAVKSGIKQLVMLAAGMDTRAYRLGLPPDFHIFELDRPEVIRYKKQKLQGEKPHCQLTSIEVDLAQDWIPVLMNSGYKKGQPTLWMVEGLVMYLEPDQVRGIFKRINQLAQKSDCLLVDILSQTLLDAPHMKSQLQFLSSIGAPWKFGENEPEKFLESFGWCSTATQAGEFAPSRWPFPTAPRNVPNVPRGFFLFGMKV